MEIEPHGECRPVGRLAGSWSAPLLLAAFLPACSGGGSAEPLRTVRGQVVDSTGAGLRWLEVRATRPGGWSPPARTADDGTFTLEGVPPTYDPRR